MLSKLDDFRGKSRFSTWADKFAPLEAGVRLRRRAWQEREAVFDPESWPAIATPATPPRRSKLRRELVPHIDSRENVPDPESP